MNAYTQSKRHDMFRLSLTGFAFTVLTSPFAVAALSSASYGIEREILVLGYPLFGTMLSAVFLALSFDRPHQRVKVLAIPTVAFGLLGFAVCNYQWEQIALWSLFFATVWLSGILRQRAYQDGHRTSALVFLGHQCLGALTAMTMLSGSWVAVPFTVTYWFSAVVSYFYLLVESGYGPDNLMVSDCPSL